MRGWVKAEEVTAGKYWFMGETGLRKYKAPIEFSALLLPDGFYWKRGRPLSDDDRWLPAKEAIAEWGEKGGNRGWWYMPTSKSGAYRVYNVVVKGGSQFYIPRGKPPIPKETQTAEEHGVPWCEECRSYHVTPKNWSQWKSLGCRKPWEGPQDPGPRMATYAVIPLETHRERLEELAVTAHRAIGHVAALNTNERTHEADSLLDDALARLLEVE